MRGTARFRDERGLLGVSLVRWILVIVLLGLVAVEGGSIIFTSIGLQNASDAAALAAADKWAEEHNFRLARQAALDSLAEQEQDEARIIKFEADGFDPFEVRMTVQKQAATLVIQRIGFLKDFAEVEVQAKAHAVRSNV
jgi:uncharacterized membrane protein